MGVMLLDYVADIYRGAGLDVIEVGERPGVAGTAWKRRARSTGGYDAPGAQGQTVHHTGSRAEFDGWPDVNYMTFYAPAQPMTNTYVARPGTLYVCAAGATNTEGRGGPWHDIPVNGANPVVWSYEIGNDGRGEPYPVVQQDAIREACAVSLLFIGQQAGWFKNGPADFWRMFSHAEWAPNRKSDPWGPSRWSSGRRDMNTIWNVRAMAADVWGRANQLLGLPKPPPVPPPSPVAPDMRRVNDGLYYVRRGDGPWSVAERAYGDPFWRAALIPTNPLEPGFKASGHLIHTPGIGGIVTTMRKGEGPIQVMARCRPDRNPANWLHRFYAFNGDPQTRTLHPGDVVFVPDW